MIKAKHLLAVLVGVLFSSSVVSQITLSPQELELKDTAQAEKVFITHDGKPVLPAEITKIVTGVFKFRDDVPRDDRDGTHFSNYSHMFDFKADDDGSITITGKKDLREVGKYDLYVHTIYGTVSGLINATLSQSSPTRLRQRVNLLEFSYTITLPDYSLGQTIAVSLPSDEVNTYYWYINGELHSSGLGETSFRVKPDAGTYEISFIARNPEGEVVSTWSDTTLVSK